MMTFCILSFLMTKLIVALDVDNRDWAFKLVNILSPQVEFFKVGFAPYIRFGNELLQELRQLNKKVFLDLKFHDIPSTVKEVTRAAAEKGVYMISFHCLGGLRMLQAAVEGINETSLSEKPLLLGITILTSMGVEEMQSIGLSGTVANKVIDLAKLAKEAGFNGVVASAKEAKMIKERIRQDFLTITPGIRPLWSMRSQEDQKRIVTPAQAVSEGADYIVVGRPILQAEDQLKAANKIIEELEETSEKIS
jgi:orotidine-5'-phosphate decarboxylase